MVRKHAAQNFKFLKRVLNLRAKDTFSVMERKDDTEFLVRKNHCYSHLSEVEIENCIEHRNKREAGSLSVHGSARLPRTWHPRVRFLNLVSSSSKTAQ